MKRWLRSWRGPCLLLPLLWAAGDARAHPGQEEAQLKAAFIYRFAQFTQWPPPPPGREFNYCVAGDRELQDAMRVVAQKPMGQAAGRVLVLGSPAEAGPCHVLVLGFAGRQELQLWLDALADSPLLVVGASAEAFRAGAIIALVLEPNGMAFRINHSEAKRRGLMLSSQMLKLAREVK
ncbi:YfiR family protein [Paucibacter sp. DJ2R-2]|uniref:YfiR family protein n=1 Tax=Paucibacter sp. DJ2R-2 TaxID=2893558 RepID=UPI0021E3FF80|nr:YfiR family protein [Paucibacter sp. DJ2R-2]MCV2422360.1 YfiR family protein [Paucibacter sp. DJ4R-1]MCV2440488.1 YfiR family protein [Paucibacter sp. DJ2R-2]